jgi:hypothetical protein
MYQSDTPLPSERPRRALSIFLATIAVVLIACNGVVFWRRNFYDAEIRRLRAAMSDVERRRTDAVIAAEHQRLRVAVALLRRQARIEPELHLAVAVDSNAMYLERDGALLRTMPVLVAPDRTIGTPPDTVQLAAPRGVRTVERVLGPNDAWEIPEWVYADRGLAPPADRAIPGALGELALVLDGGAVVYALPAAGPLNDSSFVFPGAIRVRHQDLMAIGPVMSPGMRVYFY